MGLLSQIHHVLGFGSAWPETVRVARFPVKDASGPFLSTASLNLPFFCNIKRHVVGLGSVWPVSVLAARLCQNRVTSLNIPFTCDFYIKRCHV